MSNDASWLSLFRAKTDWIEDACELCHRNPMFAGVAPKSIRWLVSRMHRRNYEAGENIFTMGNAGAGAVLILGGRVALSANGISLGEMGRGDLFGEVALVTDLPRTAEVTALEDTELLFFLRSDLQEWLAIMPKEAAKLLQNLASMMANRLMERNQTLAEQGDA